MAIKNIEENPTNNDQILFNINILDDNNCFVNPYIIESIQIYFIERSTVNENYKSYNENLTNPELIKNLEIARKNLCNNPTSENQRIFSIAQNEYEKSLREQISYFKDTDIIFSYGTEDQKVWKSTGNDNLIDLKKDEDGENINGQFEFIWDATGVKEGDYFLCYCYKLTSNGNLKCIQQKFYLSSNSKATALLPHHITNSQKYKTLLTKYTPEFLKMYLCDDDLTPEIIDGLNDVFAKIFTLLEDNVNRINTILDANMVQENILPALGNNLGVKLKTSDSTLWRKQIKDAVPLYKMKGTYEGLKKALDHIGVILNSVTYLWQVMSKYTFQECIIVNNDEQNEFILSKQPYLPINNDNYYVKLRKINESEFSDVDLDNINIESKNLIWLGNDLNAGDEILILYQIAEIPNEDEQSVDEYIRFLPLADQRDIRNQNYPPINWNVKLIEETDSLFSIIIPQINPFFDPLVFGQIQTEFPYSENIYNADNYNGSLRDSNLPCDISKNFIDTCYACKSSYYNIDLTINNITNDKLLETIETLREFTPLYLDVHSLKISGGLSDFILPPIEDIKCYVTYKKNELIITNSQGIFNRTMNISAQLNKNEISELTELLSDNGTIYNQKIMLFDPVFNLEDTPIHKINSSLNRLEILTGSNQGTYYIKSSNNNYAEIDLIESPDSIIEPLNDIYFDYNLYREFVECTSSSIMQSKIKKISDTNLSSYLHKIISQKEIDENNLPVDPWKIKIISLDKSYIIKEILANSKLILIDDNDEITELNDEDYLLLDNEDDIILSSSGNFIVEGYGTIDIDSLGTIKVNGVFANLEDIRNLVRNNFIAEIDNNNKYVIVGFIDGKNIIINNYNDGNQVGVNVKFLNKIISSYGKFVYNDILLETSTNYEDSLGILNGENEVTDENELVYDNKFKENFLIKINDDYFNIKNINGTNIKLEGINKNWETSGESINFTIYQLQNNEIEIPERKLIYTPGHVFEEIKRNGNNIIVYTNQNNEIGDLSILSILLNNKSNLDDSLKIGEEISYEIEYK